MSRTKEADLISALYLYASRCWAEGDLAALRVMGFGRQEIEDLLSLQYELENQMIGGQLGLRWLKRTSRWNVSSEFRAFAFQKFLNRAVLAAGITPCANLNGRYPRCHRLVQCCFKGQILK